MEMIDRTELFTFLAVIVAPIVCIILYEILKWFSKWLQAKETDQLKVFDYKIAAAENEMDYGEAAFSDIFPFDYIALELRKSREHRHCFNYSTDRAHIKIFDESYSNSGSQYLGIWVEFKEKAFPRFGLQRSYPSQNFHPHMYMGDVRLAPTVDWLSGNYKVIKPYKERSRPINNRLAQSEDILTLIERNDFLILTVRGRHLCLYFEMPLPANSHQLHQLKRDANLLVNTFIVPIDLSTHRTDIEQLKRDQQANDQDVG